jgi:hypothetical protein
MTESHRVSDPIRDFFQNLLRGVATVAATQMKEDAESRMRAVRGGESVLGAKVAHAGASLDAAAPPSPQKLERAVNMLTKIASEYSPAEYAESRREAIDFVKERIRDQGQLHYDSAGELAEEAIAVNAAVQVHVDTGLRTLESDIGRLEAAGRDFDALVARTTLGGGLSGGLLSKIEKEAKRASDRVEREARRARRRATQLRDGVASTLLPSEIRGFGRRFDREMRRFGRRFEAEAWRGVSNVQKNSAFISGIAPYLSFIPVIGPILNLLTVATLASVEIVNAAKTHRMAMGAIDQIRAQVEIAEAALLEMRRRFILATAEVERLIDLDEARLADVSSSLSAAQGMRGALPEGYQPLPKDPSIAKAVGPSFAIAVALIAAGRLL